jgi:hypothetical protein
MATDPIAGKPVPITTVGIPTRDRVPSLARCLAGLVEVVRRGPGSPDLVVVDDSTPADRRAATREVLESLRGRYPGRLFYAGPEAKERFARRLAAHAGLDPDDVSFGLVNVERCPVATGTSRNLLLLHAAGELLLQLDDDTVCRLAPAPGARAGLVRTSRHDPTEFWFPEPGAPEPGGPFAPHDLPAVHESLLGKEMAELPSVVEPELSRAGVTSPRAEHGRVRVTAAGVAGDSGMSSPLYLLTLGGESRDRLVGSEAVYRAAVGGGPLLRAVTRPTVGHGSVCQALNLGLDLRELLPPFMPVQRNQDGVFAALIRACCPDTYFGFLPWLIVHQPPHARVFTGDDLARSVTSVRSDHVLQLLIRASATRCAGTVADNLRAVGEALAGLGALPPGEFAELVRLRVSEQRTGLARRFAALLEEHGGRPDWWAADVRRLRDVLQGSLAGSADAAPDDLCRAFGADAALPLFQRLVSRFGRLLRCWPAMVDAAGDLRARGVRPADVV